jgi:uncharacterized protein with FMN-binding domain
MNKSTNPITSTPTIATTATVSPNATRTRPTPTTTKRRHAAKKTRVAAVGLSLVTTGILTGVFAKAEPANAATVASTAATTYTGAVATNKWGPVQVKLTVTSGHITNISTLQLPSRKPKSVRLSTNAATVIRTEVLTAQSTQVDTVSGATMTSRSYLESLQNAVDQARAAGTLTTVN